jgi:hypothetical protein
MKAFATEFDPRFSSRRSGWHAAALSMRLMVNGGLQWANGLIGLKYGHHARNRIRVSYLSEASRGITTGRKCRSFTAKLLVFKRAATSGDSL